VRKNGKAVFYVQSFKDLTNVIIPHFINYPRARSRGPLAHVYNKLFPFPPALLQGGTGQIIYSKLKFKRPRFEESRQ
jgi:hypothetical protein